VGRLLRGARRPPGRIALEKPFTSVDAYFRSYGTLVALAVAGAGLVAVAILLARVVAPRRLLPEKLTTYECGIDPVGEGWSQSQIRYYIYAFLFVIFDVESVFLFPWAVVFERLGMYAVVSMTIFIAVLGLGLLYAWRKGVLRWA
jgi:NADH-quinone oxidoreductase subunit A